MFTGAEGLRRKLASTVVSITVFAVAGGGLDRALAQPHRQATAPAARQLAALEAAPLALPGPAAAPLRVFTIQSILDKMDKAHGRTRAPAIELAPLPPSTVTTTVSTAATTTITAAVTTVPSGRPGVQAVQTADEEPFGLVGFRAPEGQLWVKWRGLQKALRRDAQTLADCRANRAACGSDSARRFLAIVDEAQTRHDRAAQIAIVNRLVNVSIRYTSDMAQWGVLDRWSPPLETFATLKGDCEDYAIAKYVALRDLGFDPSSLKVLLVKDTRVQQDHAVLAVHQDGHWLILDNRWSFAVEDHETHSLVALYALDHEGVKLVAAPYVSEVPRLDVTGMASATMRNIAEGIPASGPALEAVAAP